MKSNGNFKLDSTFGSALSLCFFQSLPEFHSLSNCICEECSTLCATFSHFHFLPKIHYCTVKDGQRVEKLVLWTHGHLLFTSNMKIVIVFESKLFVFKVVKHVPPTSVYQQIDVSFYKKL